jgi:hypothetical protein
MENLRLVFCTGLLSAALIPLHDPRMQGPEASAEAQKAREELDNG